jgi:hypothetical protein
LVRHPGTSTSPDSNASSTVHVSRSMSHGLLLCSGRPRAAALNRPGNTMSMLAAMPS